MQPYVSNPSHIRPLAGVQGRSELHKGLFFCFALFWILHYYYHYCCCCYYYYYCCSLSLFSLSSFSFSFFFPLLFLSLLSLSLSVSLSLSTHTHDRKHAHNTHIPTHTLALTCSPQITVAGAHMRAMCSQGGPCRSLLAFRCLFWLTHRPLLTYT